MKKLFSTVIIFSLQLLFSSLSFSQTSFNMYLLANLDEHGSGYSACWGYTAANGREYAILGCNTGTAFIDITDSANIREVDFQFGLTSGWREMKVYSHYAYVVSEATGSVLQIIDLQYLPDSIRFVGTYTFSGYSRTHAISQSGPYLYLNGGNYGVGGVVVLDLTNPEAPVKRGEWESKYVHDSRILNDTIWACNIGTGHVSIINAVNKDNLQTVTEWLNIPSPNAPHNCDISKNRKYIFVTDEVFSNPPGKLKVWNIENLSNITFVTTWQVTGTTASIHNIEIYGDTAAIAYYSEGIRMLNLSNPQVPSEFAWYKTASIWGVFMFGSKKIIGSSIGNGLFVVKMGTPSGIKPLEGEIPEKFSLSQNYPNPFNPITNIKFDVPTSNLTLNGVKGLTVRLKIFDALGRELETLINEELKPGNYEVNWDAGDYPSGVYFYRLITDDFTDAKKMILLK